MKDEQFRRLIIIIYLLPAHLFSRFCGFSSLLYKLSILCRSWLSKIKSISYTSKERLFILIFFLLLLFGWNYEFFASITIISIFMYKSWWLWRETCIIRRGQWQSPETHLCMILENEFELCSASCIVRYVIYVLMLWVCFIFFSICGMLLQPHVDVNFVHSTVATHNLVVNIVDYVAP